MSTHDLQEMLPPATVVESSAISPEDADAIKQLYEKPFGLGDMFGFALRTMSTHVALSRTPEGGVASAIMMIHQGDHISLPFVATDPDYGRHGFGTAAIRAVESFAKLHDVATLSVDVENTRERDAARRFFTTLGFQATKFGNHYERLLPRNE